MSVDVKSMSRKELVKLQRDIEKALERLKKQDLKAAKAAAEKAAAAHGFSLSELSGSPATKTAKGPKAAKKAGKPKYRNPSDASQTWTGKGRQPDWYKSAIADGTDPSSLAI